MRNEKFSVIKCGVTHFWKKNNIRKNIDKRCRSPNFVRVGLMNLYLSIKKKNLMKKIN